MLQQVMHLARPFAHHAAHHVVHTWATGNPVVERANLGIPDTLFIFVVALVVFGPKRLPEIGKQIGKLVFEFRRASNDFKLQIEEELRVAEQQDRQKQLDANAATKPTTPAVAAAQLAAGTTTSDAQTEAPAPPDRSLNDRVIDVQLPASGTPVSALPPNHAAVNVEPPTPDPQPETPSEPKPETQHG